MYALIAVALVASQTFPKHASDFEGLYVIRRGFENVYIELKPGGVLTMAQEFDHPGTTHWEGKWSFAKEKLQVTVKYVQGGKSSEVSYSWIPLAWGDRLMLVDEGEVREGITGKLLREEAERLNKLEKRDEIEMTYTKVAVRVKDKDDRLPFRYGRIIASEEFEAYFADIDLRLPKKS